jgi:hypothetical protein
VEGVSQETRFIKGFFFRGWNPSLVETLTNFAADAETGFFTTSGGGREPRNPVYKRFLCYEQIRDCPFFSVPCGKIVKFFSFRQKAIMHKAMMQKARDAKFTPNTSIAHN